MEKADNPEMSNELECNPLRARALRWLHGRPTPAPSASSEEIETGRLLEELRIYQAELEVQNDELRGAQSRTDRLLQRFSLLFREAPVCMLLVDRYGVIRDANSQAIEHFRITNHHARHHLLFRMISESSRAMVESGLARAENASRDAAPILLPDVEMLDISGAMLSGDFSVLRLPRSGPGEDAEFLCVFTDHTALTRLGKELATQNDELRLFAQAFEQVSEAIMVTDLDGTILLVNHAFTRITGYAAEQAVGQRAHMLASGHTADQTYRHLWASLLSQGHWEGELSNRRADGVVYPEWISIETLRNGSGEPWRYVAIFHDLTQTRAQEDALRRLAQEDALTGLPNRHMMPSLVSQAFERARRSGGKVAIMFVDLDNFKGINDSLGHQIGDETLAMVAQRLSKRLRDTDRLVRLGGDEFLVVAENLHSAGDAGQLAQALLETLSAPLVLSGGRQLFVSCSMGVGLFPDDGDNAELLLQEADTAMYRAKSSGRGRFEFFSPALMEHVQEEFNLTTDLRHALTRAELFVEFQPLVPVRAELPLEVETLVRWRHPQRGVLSPATFIGIAERSGLIGDLSLEVLNLSCRAMRKWLDAGVPVAAVAVNISFRDIESIGLAERVEEVLAANGLSGEQLKIELTESDIMRDVVQTRKTLERLRRLGVRIAVDDFGTGFSSLAHLHMLPLDTLKIDASFVSGIDTDANAQSITQTIVALGRALRLRLVAEGVETAGQRDRLKELGVDYMQGWYFSKAIGEAQLAAAIAQLTRP